MPPASHILAFALTSAVLIVVPGPSVLFTIGRALTIGRRGALVTVIGNASGQLVQVVAVACGIGAIVERSIVAYMAIKLIGAAYLVFLGVQAIRHRRDLGVAVTGQRSRSPGGRRVFLDGLVVGLSNPKSIVLFVAVLPQFVDPTSGDGNIQLLVLGAVFPLIALVSDSVWALGAGSARAWFARSPRRISTVGGAGGLAMVGLGAGLAVSGRPD